MGGPEGEPSILADGEFATPTPFHRFIGMMMGSGSMPVRARWDDPSVDGDATVDVFVPSPPSSACQAASSGSREPTTRLSAALLLNKPLANPQIQTPVCRPSSPGLDLDHAKEDLHGPVILLVL